MRNLPSMRKNQVDCARKSKPGEKRVSQLTDEISTLTEQIDSLSKDLENRVQLRPEELAVPHKPEQLNQLEEELNQLRTQEFEKRVELGGAKERISQLSLRLRELKEELDSTEHKLAAAVQRKIERDRQLEVSNKQLQNLPRLRELIGQSLEKAREKAEGYAAERNSLTEKLAHYRAQAEEIRQKLQSSQAEVQSSEMRKHELLLSKNTLVEKISDELGLAAEELLRADWQSDETEESLKQQLRQAKIDFAQLGQFNPMALEQLEALQQRHEYLKEQLADVEAARKDLRGIIATLDEPGNRDI